MVQPAAATCTRKYVEQSSKYNKNTNMEKNFARRKARHIKLVANGK